MAIAIDAERAFKELSRTLLRRRAGNVRIRKERYATMRDAHACLARYGPDSTQCHAL